MTLRPLRMSHLNFMRNTIQLGIRGIVSVAYSWCEIYVLRFNVVV